MRNSYHTQQRCALLAFLSAHADEQFTVEQLLAAMGDAAPGRSTVYRALDRLVAEGTGVSILSALAVQEAVAAGQLLQFELDETPVRRSIYMARRRKSSMSSPARTFAELVRKQAKASV